MWSVHKRHREAWKVEYRRLTSEIFKARKLIRIGGDNPSTNDLNYVYKVLSNAYGDICDIRPRKQPCPENQTRNYAGKSGKKPTQ